jgi:hypothetical protein
MTAGVETQTALQTPKGPARLLDRALSRLLRLPAARNDFSVERDVRAPMRDGVVLLTVGRPTRHTTALITSLHALLVHPHPQPPAVGLGLLDKVPIKVRLEPAATRARNC